MNIMLGENIKHITTDILNSENGSVSPENQVEFYKNHLKIVNDTITELLAGGTDNNLSLELFKNNMILANSFNILFDVKKLTPISEFEAKLIMRKIEAVNEDQRIELESKVEEYRLGMEATEKSFSSLNMQNTKISNELDAAIAEIEDIKYGQLELEDKLKTANIENENLKAEIMKLRLEIEAKGKTKTKAKTEATPA